MELEFSGQFFAPHKLKCKPLYNPVNKCCMVCLNELIPFEVKDFFKLNLFPIFKMLNSSTKNIKSWSFIEYNPKVYHLALPLFGTVSQNLRALHTLCWYDTHKMLCIFILRVSKAYILHPCMVYTQTKYAIMRCITKCHYFVAITIPTCPKSQSDYMPWWFHSKYYVLRVNTWNGMFFFSYTILVVLQWLRDKS